MEETKTDLVELIREALEAGKGLINTTGITKSTSLKKRFCLLALNDIVRKGESIVAMIDGEAVTGGDIVFRSLLESLVDLLNIIAYPNNYPHYMMYRSSLEVKKNLDSVRRRPTDPYASSIINTAMTEFGRSVEDMIEELEQGMAYNRGKLTKQYFDGNRTRNDPSARVNTSAKRRFDLAQMEDAYESMYRICSGKTHSSVSSMLTGVGAAGTFDWPPEELEPSMSLLDSTAGAVITGLQRTARNINKPVGTANALKKRLTAIRATYSDL